MNKINYGFSLIELMIVIGIIAILASIAIPLYMRYQNKAKVTSYALSIARACALDIMAYCIQHPGETINENFLPNCKANQTTPEGALEVSVTYYNGTCEADGTVNSTFLVQAVLSDIKEYKVICEQANRSLRCYFRKI